MKNTYSRTYEEFHLCEFLGESSSEITQLFGKKVRLTGAWRGLAWLGGGHRFARFSAFPWHRLRSNNPETHNIEEKIQRIDIIIAHILVETSPFRRWGRDALLVSSFSLSQRLTQGGERKIDGWIDERILETDFTTRRADNGNPLSVTENFRGRESRLLGRGFLKMEGNPVKIERQ